MSDDLAPGSIASPGQGWDFKMNGKHVKPHYMLARGVVYFTISGFWVMSGRGAVDNLPGIEEPKEKKNDTN